jgi:uncharacterized protein YdiU (UPF0061 family)
MANNELTDEQLRSIYAWIDAIPLSRPKRNMARDFSDGVLVAEVIAAYFPDLVDLHNYVAANSVQQKVYNFETLNQKILRKLGYQLDRSTIDNLVNCRSGCIEQVLNTLQYKMAKYREKKSKLGSNSPGERSKSAPRPERRDNVNNVQENVQANINSESHTNQKKKSQLSNANPQSKIIESVDKEILLEKEQQIKELQETIEILELKVAKLEQLVRLKDSKIQKLSQQK